ncbi:MAG TPA: hypothetical protein V6D22_06320 [Candidatus Obscuribacterales bacterium]
MSILSLALLVLPAAQATLLKGYIKADETAPASAAITTPSAPQSASAAPVYGPPIADEDMSDRASTAPLPSPAEAAMHKRTARLEKALVDADSFPASFAGSWRVVTVVTGSAVPTVPVGERIVSQVSFARQTDGRILARWQQPGWNDAQERVTAMNDHEAALDRTNYFEEQGVSGEWSARSHDHYLQVGTDRMVASSEVEQFIAGTYMGRYQTRSTLYRVNNSVAFAAGN